MSDMKKVRVNEEDAKMKGYRIMWKCGWTQIVVREEEERYYLYNKVMNENVVDLW